MALRISNQLLKTSEVLRHTKMKACKFWKDQYLVMTAKLKTSAMAT